MQIKNSPSNSSYHVKAFCKLTIFTIENLQDCSWNEIKSIYRKSYICNAQILRPNLHKKVSCARVCVCLDSYKSSLRISHESWTLEYDNLGYICYVAHTKYFLSNHFFFCLGDLVQGG